MYSLRVAMLLLTSTLFASQVLAKDDEVLSHDGITVTQHDIAEYLSERLLPEVYESALSRPGAIAQAVGNIFIIRKAANQARELGLVRPQRELWLAKNAPNRYAVDQLIAFETDLRMESVDWTALSMEQYLLEPEQVGVEKEVAVSHILISLDQRNFNELATSVAAVEQALQDGQGFEDLAREMSDDPSVERNGGSLGYIRRGQTAPKFEAAAFAMETPGSVSAPILSSYGVHFIRFDGERQTQGIPFSQRRSALIAKLKKQQAEEMRPLILEPLRNPVLPMLVSLDEELLRVRILKILSDS